MDFYPSQFFEHVIDLFSPDEPVWNGLGRIHEYLMSLKLGSIEGEVSGGAFLVNPELISIGKGTVVEAGAYLIGPLWIGENCQIRHGAYLRTLSA